MCEFTILMPCLNEAETLATCIAKARGFFTRNGIDGEVLIADNGSADGSPEIARSMGVRVIHVTENGYGNALMAGVRAARGRYVIMGDADDSYDFSALAGFVDRLRAGQDLVMGNRFDGGIQRGAMPPLHRYLGNPVLSFIGRLFFRVPVSDFHCGLRGFNRASIMALDLRTSGMEFASEMIVKAQLNRLTISEVPIVLHPDGRTREPHLRSWRDGWRHLRFLLLFSPRWLFLYPGLVLTVVGLLATAVLVVTPFTVGPLRFGAGSLFAMAVLSVIGYQAVLFAVLTKVYGQEAGFLPPNPRFNRIVGVVRLETGLLVGFGLIIAGITAGVMTYLRWRESNWGAIGSEDLRSAVPAALGLVLGCQTILSSFFLSILGLPRHGPTEPVAIEEMFSSDEAPLPLGDRVG